MLQKQALGKAIDAATKEARKALPRRKRRKRSASGAPLEDRPATGRQEAFLEAIERLTAREGRAPSAVEIAERLGISRQCATRQLVVLERKGLLRDVPRMVRSGQWALTHAGLALRG
jgi:response regulator of citrate/malate metabolism